MSPTRSKTTVFPSGETSRLIQVPSVTSYSIALEFVRFAMTSHFAGTAVLVAGAAPPEGGLGGGGGGGFCAASGMATEKAARTRALCIRIERSRVGTATIEMALRRVGRRLN